jgi:hypothetical protein
VRAKSTTRRAWLGASCLLVCDRSVIGQITCRSSAQRRRRPSRSSRA